MRPRKSVVAWSPKLVTSGTGRSPISTARRRDLRVQLEELRAGKDSLLRVVDAVVAAVDACARAAWFGEDEARGRSRTSR